MKRKGKFPPAISLKRFLPRPILAIMIAFFQSKYLDQCHHLLAPRVILSEQEYHGKNALISTIGIGCSQSYRTFFGLYLELIELAEGSWCISASIGYIISLSLMAYNFFLGPGIPSFWLTKYFVFLDLSSPTPLVKVGWFGYLFQKCFQWSSSLWSTSFHLRIGFLAALIQTYFPFFANQIWAPANISPFPCVEWWSGSSSGFDSKCQKTKGRSLKKFTKKFITMKNQGLNIWEMLWIAYTAGAVPGGAPKNVAVEICIN